MQKTNAGPEAKAEIERQEMLKKRAAKQAAKRELPPEEIPTVTCVVLPKGDGKISMGEHIAGLGTVHYEEGETFPCLLPNALFHYERGYVNFEGAREAAAELEARRAAANDAALAQSRAVQAAYEKLISGGA